MQIASHSRPSRSKEAGRVPIQDFEFSAQLDGADGATRQLLCVGDFSTGSKPGAAAEASRFVTEVTGRLHELGLDLDPASFLDTLASALNDFLLGFKEPGRESPARCTAMFALVDGDRCHYLGVGDARLAVVRGSNILLPAGSDWYVSDQFRNKHPGGAQRLNSSATPAFLGAGFADGPLGQVRSLRLREDDVLLLYSDGLESVSPEQRVKIVQESRADPDRIAHELVAQAADDDDVLVTVAVGPFPLPLVDQGLAEIRRALEPLSAYRSEAEARFARIDQRVNTIEESSHLKLDEFGQSIRSLREGLASAAEFAAWQEQVKKLSSDVGSLRSEVASLRTGLNSADLRHAEKTKSYEQKLHAVEHDLQRIEKIAEERSGGSQPKGGALRAKNVTPPKIVPSPKRGGRRSKAGLPVAWVRARLRGLWTFGRGRGGGRSNPVGESIFRFGKMAIKALLVLLILGLLGWLAVRGITGRDPLTVYAG